MNFNLDTIGQGMQRGAALASKVTGPVGYGMKTLKNQLVKPMGMIGRTGSAIVKSPNTLGSAIGNKIAGANIGGFIKQQNDLKNNINNI